MIFVTVGANTPFDRMIRCVDEWAGERGRTDVFAQIGRTSFRPRHIEWREMLTPQEFRESVRRASAIVAHAGMGTILSALEAGVPILVMPRRAALREQRNDHQLATARHLAERGLVHVARDEAELRTRLDELVSIRAHEPISPVAPPPLVERLRSFIAGAPPDRADRS